MTKFLFSRDALLLSSQLSTARGISTRIYDEQFNDKIQNVIHKNVMKTTISTSVAKGLALSTQRGSKPKYLRARTEELACACGWLQTYVRANAK